MSLVELLLIAVGLSMDAFAVSIAKGLGMRRMVWRHAVYYGLLFGAFQALMPTLGYFLGTQLQGIVAPWDHWIVFGLLSYIGGSMIWEAVHDTEDDVEVQDEPAFDLREALLLAVATSIDALATGISFALLDVDIVFAATAIGLTTFAFSVVAVWIGNQFGSRWKRGASVAGGIVLIAIGTKVLLEHLGIIAF